MNVFKKPAIAFLVAVLVVICSTTVTTSMKLNNKSEAITEGFYSGVKYQGVLNKSIYHALNELCDIATEVIVVADNYGISTKELRSTLDTLRQSISYRNSDIDNIYYCYANFYNSLRNVQIDLSNTGLSQRHIEYMTTATGQIILLKQDIEQSAYNESVAKFYKKFDRFPVNIFANLFEIEYPEYFA